MSIHEIEARIIHHNLRLRLIDYAGTMTLFAYCNQSEFFNLRLSDAVIPDTGFQTGRVASWAYEQSEVHHQADAFIGNMIVHGGGAALDNEINAESQNWWNGIKQRFLSLQSRGLTASPANTIRGNNVFDASITNYSQLATCTFAIESASDQGSIIILAIVQLYASSPNPRTTWTQTFRAS